MIVPAYIFSRNLKLPKSEHRREYDVEKCNIWTITKQVGKIVWNIHELSAAIASNKNEWELPILFIGLRGTFRSKLADWYPCKKLECVPLDGSRLQKTFDDN
jgi:hypothetical protein